MSEFPRAALEELARNYMAIFPERETKDMLRQAIEAYDALSERCVMDRTAHSLEVAALREEKENLHRLLNLSPVVADYPSRLAALHRVRDREIL